ncbi:MAG: hypothetical protein RL213_491 [Bacteroidota bacterium]|jgi:hypothetical protein
MERVERHIRSLLRSEEILIIPQMGCFRITGNPDDARTERSGEDSLSFDTTLQYNDGVLAEQIAGQEHISYEEALSSISGYVHDVREQMRNEGAYLLQQVGTFYLDDSNTIRFNRDIPAEEGGNEGQTTETAVGAERLSGKSLLKRTVVAVLLMAISGWFLYETYRLYLGVDATAIPLPKEGRNEIPVVRSSDAATAEPATVEPTNNLPAAAVTTTADQATLTNTSPAAKTASTPTSYYYLVAGTFRSEDNAQRLLEDLKTAGYSNASAFTDKRGYHVVTLDQFESKTDAIALQRRLKTDGTDVLIVRK